MTVDLAWRFVRQLALTGLPITCHHLLIAFVDVKGAAESSRRSVTIVLQLWQTMQKHVDLENGPFVRSIRFVSLVQNLRQHVATKVN